MLTSLLRRYRRLQAEGERGVALITVIGIGMVLAVMVGSGVALATTMATKASTDDDWNSALAAAYAGVADYQSRITNDNTYMEYGNKSAPFSQSTGSSTLVLPSGAATNKAFGIGAGGTWQPVAGASGNQAFRYEVDNSDYAAQGIIRILATGRSGSVTRSVLADVRQRGFLDYLYFTNYEVQDPQITGKTQCAAYNYAVGATAARPSSCDPIVFQTKDTVDGPMHSNDKLDICGGTFTSTVTSSNPTTPMTFCSSTLASGFKLTVNWEAPLLMPPTNAQMKQETMSTASRPSCLYTGPTKITYNSNGTMTVISPWTKTTYLDGSATKQNPICGTPGTATGQLGSASGQTFTVPDDNLIFVQTVPSLAGDPNYWAANAKPSGWADCPTNGNNLGFPTAGESVIKTAAAVYYGCRTGDAFVKGVVNGQSTVAAENYIWITGDITYQDPTASVLGLVGQNSVWVWNPIGSKTSGKSCNVTADPANATDTGYCTNLGDFSSGGRTIDAAMLSVSHTVQVQNYDLGGYLGSLNVLGAIAQQFRGPVGTSGSTHAGTGFDKGYTYDLRLKYIAPPKFLQAVSTTYGVTQYTSVKPSFNADGSNAG